MYGKHTDERLAQFYASIRSKSMRVEEFIVEVIRELLSDGPEFFAIDGGAHKGFHTLALVALDPCAGVIAVEADPFTSVKLRASVERSPHAAKVAIVEAALQDNEALETIRFASSESHPGRSGIAQSVIWQKDKSVVYRPPLEVKATTIDRLARDATRAIKFVKLDLEGGEYAAMRGAQTTLRRDRPILVFENSVRAPKISGFTPRMMLDFFLGLEYHGTTFSGREATEGNFYEYHEMWAIPFERREEVSAVIHSAVERFTDTA